MTHFRFAFPKARSVNLRGVEIGQFVRARSPETDVTHSYDRGVTHSYGGGVSHTCFEAFSVGLFVRLRMGRWRNKE